MPIQFELRLDPSPIELDGFGLRLVAPGLLGSAQLFSRSATGARDDPGPTDLLDRAIAEAGLERRHLVRIEAPTPPASAGSARSAGAVGIGEVELQVPVRADETSLVIYRDEAGVISLHYARRPAADAKLAASRASGPARSESFRIPLRAGRAASASGGRGPVGGLLAKILRVVIVKLLPDPIGAAACRRVRHWELTHRSFEGFHGGTAAQLMATPPTPPTPPTPVSDFEAVRRRPALLFLHGTTSSTAGAFGQLANTALLARLYAAYEGNVIGFNHPTMSASIADNVRAFFDALAPAAGHYVFDIVCHSRGGLLARALTDLDDRFIAEATGSAWRRPPAVSLDVRRIVFVATPNAGTALAIPDNIAGLVERLVNVVNFLPDSVLTIAAGALMSIAASIAEVGLPRLPGLADQAPGSALLQALRPAPAAVDGYRAFEAAFKPQRGLVDALGHAALDSLFDSHPNDLVVPTDGVSTTPFFRLGRDRVFRFAADDAVHHTNFFGHPAMAEVEGFLGLEPNGQFDRKLGSDAAP